MSNSSYINKGAKLTTSLFSNKAVSNLMDSMIYTPVLNKDGGILNPADPYSPNGLLGQLNQNDISNIKYTPEDYPNVIKTNFTENLNKVNAITEEDLEESEGGYDSGFTSIPRLAGLLGKYVTPPSKVSLAQLHDASLDSTLGAILQVAKSLIIAKIGKYHHPNKRIDRLVNYSLERLEDSNLLFRGLDYLDYGFSVGEIKWGVTKDRYNYIDSVTFAPPTNIEFMVDDLGKVSAALQSNLTASQYGTFQGQPYELPESAFAARELIPRVLPYTLVERENLFYIGYDADYSPYGISPLRRAYKYYDMKNLAIAMLMTALQRNGAPLLALYYQKDMIKNEEQKQALEEQVDKLAVGGSLYLPGRKGDSYEADSLRVDSSNLGVYLDFVSYCDTMMVRSMGFPPEILLGTGGSYSSGAIQKETYEDNLQLYCNTEVKAIYHQIIRPIIDTNFSKNTISANYGKYMPNVRDSEKVEKLKQFEMGASCGVIDPYNRSDVNVFREAIGLSKLDEGKLPIENNLQIQKKDMQEFMKTPFREQNGKPFSNDEQ